MTRLLDILKTFSANSRQICRLAPAALLCALMIGVCFTNDAYAEDLPKCVQGISVAQPCKCGNNTCQAGQYCTVTSSTTSSSTVGGGFSGNLYTCSDNLPQNTTTTSIGGSTTQGLVYGRCPTTDLLRAKYSSGCWSCLVVEKLSSAFMTAASKAYGIAQRAGLVLLGLGAVLWILVWGLRNVSSLTQLEPGNILNELLKFGFKVALAYLLITFGLKVVGTYFINPIMGVGAKIAETFWIKTKSSLILRTMSGMILMKKKSAKKNKRPCRHKAQTLNKSRLKA